MQKSKIFYSLITIILLSGCGLSNMASKYETVKFDVIKERHPMRHFSIQEIKLLAIIAGFEFVRAEEFMSSEIPSKNTWGVCFILKKEK